MAKSKNILECVRAEMARKQLTVSDLALAVGISRISMSEKLGGNRPIWLSEAFAIQKTVCPDKSIDEIFVELKK